MPKKRKPPDERSAEAYQEAADNSMELAKALAGEGGIGDQDFLARMVRSNDTVDHQGETCGICHQIILGAEIAREMIEAGVYEDVMQTWSAEAERRWMDSKFYKVWTEESKAGRDPRKAFEERGWEP